MANSKSGETVLQRVVRILEAFDHEHPARTAAEIARSTELSPSTAHRLATEMVEVGLLGRHENGQFVIGRRAWELTARSSPLEELRTKSQPVMEAVHSTLQEKIFLTVPDYEGGSVLYLERLDRYGDGEFVAQQAGRMRFYNTSPGLVLLAHTTPKIRDRILQGPLLDEQTGVVTEEWWVRTKLAEIRSRGYIAMESALTPGNSAFAVPVFGPGNKILASLSVVARSGEVNEAVVISVLVTAGRSLSRELGAGQQSGRALPWLQ